MVNKIDEPTTYTIRVKGHIAPHWSTWFDGLTMINQADGSTLLIGDVVDQAQLHGLLVRVRDLGLPLLSLIAHAEQTSARSPSNFD